MDNKLKDFLEFEKENSLFTRQYCGIYYWQSIRLVITRKILNQELSSLKKNKKKDILINFCFYLKSVLRDISNILLIKKASLLYFDQQLYRLVDGEPKDVYFDFWEFGKEYSINRCYYLNKQYSLGSGIGTAVVDLIHDVIYTISKFFKNSFKDNKEQEFITELCGKIREQFNIYVDEKVILKLVKDVIIIHKVYSPYYECLLKRTKARAIFTAEYYVIKLFPMYAVAKKYNIPVIELTHGMVCNHDAYNYVDVSDEGKELPSYFFSYGEFWHEYIRLPKCMQSVAMGNPFLENRKKRFYDNTPNEKNVIFYLDSFVGKYVLDIAIKFYQRNIENGYKVICKFHPVEERYMEEEKKLLSKYPQIICIPSNTEVYELFSMAKHHVSGPSTVLYETIGFGVEGYLVKVNKLTNLVQPLLDKELVKQVCCVEELENLLCNHSTIKHEIQNYMWKENSVKTASEFLKSILTEDVFKNINLE